MSGQGRSYVAGDIAEVEGRIAVYVPTRWEWLDGYWTAIPATVGPVLRNVYDVARAATTATAAASKDTAAAEGKRARSWRDRWVARAERRRNACRVTQEWHGSFIGRRHCATHDVAWDGGERCPRAGTPAHSAPFGISLSAHPDARGGSSCE